jgi:competence protein ComEC
MEINMKQWILIFALLFVCISSDAQKRGLDIYFVDTEGGAATLIVTPAGEATLIDSGNPGGRDAGRIHRVATQAAHLKHIDNIICTHWHLDHYGGHGPLAKLMPIKRFFDRGHPGESNDDPDNFPKLYAAYKDACGGKSTELTAGEVLGLKQAGGPKVELKCIIASGVPIPDKPSAPVNPFAKGFKPLDPDPSDNAKSLGFVLSFGGWRFLDLGDLTWNTEEKLVEPTNKIGLIDVYQTTHHGLEISNNPVLVKSVQPRVAIFNNGPRKGGHPDVTKTLLAIPGIQGIWQVHRNVMVGADLNTKPSMIANMDENCKGEFIKLSVAPDAKSYTVQIGEHGKPVRYSTRK